MMKPATNCRAWAVGTQRRNGFHVRCIRWGLLAAQLDKRDGEQIRAAFLQVEAKYKPRKAVFPEAKSILDKIRHQSAAIIGRL